MLTAQGGGARHRLGLSESCLNLHLDCKSLPTGRERSVLQLSVPEGPASSPKDAFIQFAQEGCLCGQLCSPGLCPPNGAPLPNLYRCAMVSSIDCKFHELGDHLIYFSNQGNFENKYVIIMWGQQTKTEIVLGKPEHTVTLSMLVDFVLFIALSPPV